MQINWKLKSFLFGLIAIFNLYRLLYWLQKNASKRSRVRIDKINEACNIMDILIKKHPKNKLVNKANKLITDYECIETN